MSCDVMWYDVMWLVSRAIVTSPYLWGSEHGVGFLRRFSFRCGIGLDFRRHFVKSSFGTFLLWSWTSQGMRHFQTAIAIDENTWSTWNTNIIAGLDMCKSMYPRRPFRSTLNTNVITRLDMCKCMYPRSPFRSTLNRNVTTGLDMCSCMYRSSPFRSTLDTNVITGLDMCKSM